MPRSRLSISRFHPLSWARSTANRAITGRRVASLLPGPEGDWGLRRSIASHEAALSVYSLKETPLEWAQAQNNLGAALPRPTIQLIPSPRRMPETDLPNRVRYRA